MVDTHCRTHIALKVISLVSYSRLLASILFSGDITMQNSHVLRAWKWLLAHLIIAASISYLCTLLVAGMGLMKPATILKTTTFGMPHVGGLVVNQGVSFGVDEGIMIFFCNLSVALLIVAIVYWTRLLNPHNQSRTFSRLRRHLQNDRSAERLLKISPFAEIRSSQLRLTAFLLLGAPYIATIALGLIAGTLLGIVHAQSSSPLIALAYIMPHGIPEIAALLLACSIPVGTWMTIRPVVGNECTSEAFQRIDSVLASQQLQQNLKMIINLLLIAGLVESHITLKVVAMLTGS